jgi:hydroxymethylbilane synthase
MTSSLRSGHRCEIAYLRLGTRNSVLAQVGATFVAHALRDAGAVVEVVPIVTAGDLRPVGTEWGDGAFVGAIEAALRSGEIDVAVHSTKDIPVDRDDDPDLVIAAYPARGDPRDALLARSGDSLASLPDGASVGTDSPRRRGFLLAERPDLDVRSLTGNVDTRLKRIDAEDIDALVLAAAGLERLGRANRMTEVFDAARVPPAPGQGALAVQVRGADRVAAKVVARLDDSNTRLAVTTERVLLAALGGGCRAPIGALATVSGSSISLVAGRVELDGGARRIVARDGLRGASDRLADDVAEALTR